jgi:hypothetical protein
MHLRPGLFAAAGAALLGQPALAADDPNSTTVAGVTITAQRAYPVREVTIPMGKRCLKARKPADPEAAAPRLVSTFPRRGSVVKPGLVVLRLTFDLPMTCDGLLDGHDGLLDPCPTPLNDPVISKDRRSFLTVCVLKPASHYGIWLNHSLYHRFTSIGGHELDAQEFVFDTSAAPELTTVKDALAEDKDLEAATKTAAP